MNCLIRYRNSGLIWLMKALQQSLGETLRLRIKTLPVFLMSYQWSREQKWNRARVSTVSFLTSRKTQISAWRRKYQGHLAEDVLVQSCLERNILVTWWQRIRKFSMKRVSSQETQKNLLKFPEPTRKPKVIYTDNSLEFGKSCKELSWDRCSST